MPKRSVSSVWLRARKERGDQPHLSQKRIVLAAIELLDEEGMEGLSLRRLASHLGSGVTSLYWYVSTKEELLELAVDAILAEVPLLAEPSADWKEDLRGLAVGLREVILRHPWSATLLGSFLAIGPSALAYSEAVLKVLARTGLTGELLNGALSAVFHYVVGSAITDAAWRQTLRRSGMKGTTWAEILEANAELARERSATVAEYLGQFGSDDADRRFSIGLDLVLDGLDRRAQKRG